MGNGWMVAMPVGRFRPDARRSRRAAQAAAEPDPDRARQRDDTDFAA
jgi:hypothetical protein